MFFMIHEIHLILRIDLTYHMQNRIAQLDIGIIFKHFIQ